MNYYSFYIYLVFDKINNVETQKNYRKFGKIQSFF